MDLWGLVLGIREKSKEEAWLCLSSLVFFGENTSVLVLGEQESARLQLSRWSAGVTLSWIQCPLPLWAVLKVATQLSMSG